MLDFGLHPKTGTRHLLDARAAQIIIPTDNCWSGCLGWVVFIWVTTGAKLKQEEYKVNTSKYTIGKAEWEDNQGRDDQ